MDEAAYYQKLKNDAVRCDLCPRECVILPGKIGYCQVKENRDGKLYSTIYARVSAIAVDPIEKKPLYHFYPGTQILSIGTIGCNLRCSFCQNWYIAQKKAPTEQIDSTFLVEKAVEFDSTGIAYTYSEPLIWYEFILDTGKKARKAGLKNVLVTNGLIKQEPLAKLIQYIDAVNLDVKAFNDEFYKKICRGNFLKAIKETAQFVAKRCHLEITTLLIPGLNDNPDEIRELAKWIAGISPDIPLHLNRYFPNYQLDLPPTPIETLVQAKKIAREYLHYVYMGNIVGSDKNTYCPECNYLVVERELEVKVNLKDGCCPECRTKIPIFL